MLRHCWNHRHFLLFQLRMFLLSSYSCTAYDLIENNVCACVSVMRSHLQVVHYVCAHNMWPLPRILSKLATTWGSLSVLEWRRDLTMPFRRPPQIRSVHLPQPPRRRRLPPPSLSLHPLLNSVAFPKTSETTKRKKWQNFNYILMKLTGPLLPML